jgi:hypothetical protein
MFRNATNGKESIYQMNLLGSNPYRMATAPSHAIQSTLLTELAGTTPKNVDRITSQRESSICLAFISEFYSQKRTFKNHNLSV